MRILVHEHYCGGGSGSAPLDTALLPEASAMLRCLVTDLHAAGHEIVVLLDDRLRMRLPVRPVRLACSKPSAARHALERALDTVDAALIVAPETGGILPRLLQHVEHAGVENLGSPASAVRVVSDKAALADLLRRGGVPVPDTAVGRDAAAPMLARYGAIVAKPVRGAGCLDTFVCRSVNACRRLPEREDWLVQELRPGVAASVTFVVPPSGPAVFLRGGFQRVHEVGRPDATRRARLEYRGGRLPLGASLERRAFAIAAAALERLPTLRGLVGVDVVLGATAAEDAVIEVNARPTVAYVGLRRLARFNVAETIFHMPARVAWRSGGVCYRADGRCRMIP